MGLVNRSILFTFDLDFFLCCRVCCDSKPILATIPLTCYFWWESRTPITAGWKSEVTDWKMCGFAHDCDNFSKFLSIPELSWLNIFGYVEFLNIIFVPLLFRHFLITVILRFSSYQVLLQLRCFIDRPERSTANCHLPSQQLTLFLHQLNSQISIDWASRLTKERTTSS